MTIEDIILGNDVRGISQLRDKLPADFCDQAARFILESPGPVFIITGFFVKKNWESDGPVGALVLGQALERRGFQVYYVTDGCTDMMRELVGAGEKVIDFPNLDHEASKEQANRLLDEYKPGLAVAIERCSLTEEQKYRNMRGKDISEHTAKIDYLFRGVDRTVGVGDGGNEIGMGNLFDEIPKVESLVRLPATTSATHLVIAAVSNWGAYGLAASISVQTGQNLLPSIDGEQDMVKKWVDMGGVDGFSGEQIYKVDGFSLEENSAVLEALHNDVEAAIGA